jgi:hypothetical protein
MGPGGLALIDGSPGGNAFHLGLPGGLEQDDAPAHTVAQQIKPGPVYGAGVGIGGLQHPVNHYLQVVEFFGVIVMSIGIGVHKLFGVLGCGAVVGEVEFDKGEARFGKLPGYKVKVAPVLKAIEAVGIDHYGPDSLFPIKNIQCYGFVFRATKYNVLEAVHNR